MAVPGATAVMSPFLFTFATALLFVAHLTLSSVPLGLIEYTVLCLSPTPIVSVVLDKVSPVAGTYSLTCTTTTCFFLLLSFAATVIFAFPAARAVTLPFESTMATSVLSDMYLAVL